MPVILDPTPPSTPAPDPGPLESAGDRYYARLEPVAYADAENGFPLKALAAALMSQRQLLDDVSRDQVDENGAPVIGWGPVLDPSLCPPELLPWLALLPGVELPASALTTEEKRSRVAAASGFFRGTPLAIKQAVQLTLTGSKLVRLIERPGGNPYRFTVISRVSETPDPDASERAMLSQKPAGHVATYVVSDEPLINEMTRTINSITPDIDDLTLADVT